MASLLVEVSGLLRCVNQKITPGWCDVNGKRRMRSAHLVMPGLDPGIHQSAQEHFRRGWIVGSSPAMTKDAGLSRIPCHQAAVDRDDRPGEERRRGQAQAQRHVRDLFGIAVAAER